MALQGAPYIYDISRLRVNTGRAIPLLLPVPAWHVTGRTYIAGLICAAADDGVVEEKCVSGFVEGRRGLVH
jgi:hypothetical protein